MESRPQKRTNQPPSSIQEGSKNYNSAGAGAVAGEERHGKHLTMKLEQPRKDGDTATAVAAIVVVGRLLRPCSVTHQLPESAELGNYSSHI